MLNVENAVRRIEGLHGDGWALKTKVTEYGGVEITVKQDPSYGVYSSTFIGEIHSDETMHFAEFVGNGQALLVLDEFGLWDKVPQAVWGKSYEEVKLEEQIAKIKKAFSWRLEVGENIIETKAQAQIINRKIRHFLMDEEREWEFSPMHSIEELRELEARLEKLRAGE